MIANPGPPPAQDPAESGGRFGKRKLNPSNWLPLVLILVSLFLIAACGGDSLVAPEPASTSGPGAVTPAKATSEPTIPLQAASALPEPAAPTLVRVPQPTSGLSTRPATPEIAAVSPTEAPQNTPPNTSSGASEPPTLRVLSPQDGTGVEVAALRVMGSTSGDVVRINNLPTEVDSEGNFQHDIPLRQGVNLIEVEASGAFGATTTRQLVVFSVEPTAGLPLTLLYPSDGLEVSEPSVPVVGLSALDAVVGINEIPTEVNELGIFSSTVILEEGPNLIEVVAADLSGNVRFQTVVVFYTP